MKRKGLEIKIGVDKDGNIVSSKQPVGQLTKSSEKDFYVYQWFIKETGEIFYVGKGRKDRYKTFHKNAYEAEKIRELFETDVRFVDKNLTEAEAIQLETDEIVRILNETTYILTNRSIPISTKRASGYGKSKDTPKLQFEVAPHFYASEIDQHYYNMKHKAFDKVKIENLKAVVFIDKTIARDVLETVYGGQYPKYIDKTINLLADNHSKILKNKYAQTVMAWIYSSDDYVVNINNDQDKAMKKLGRNIPTYHLIDVWRFLNSYYEKKEISKDNNILINPIHQRIPLKEIKNKNNWDKGFDEGYKYFKLGEEKRKAGNIEAAIKLFDKARYNGYLAPVLYNSYAIAYRKLKDTDNEIAILEEAITRFKNSSINVNPINITRWKVQKSEAEIKHSK